MNEWFGAALRNALTSTLGWAAVILATFVVGVCAGYWLGHGTVMSAERTFKMFLWLPFLWLNFPEMFLAYGVMALAWYLPLCYESRSLRIVAAGANLLVWLFVVRYVVVLNAGSKWFRF